FGIRVMADDPVSVYAYHHRLYFSEASMAMPIERLGTDHLVLAHEDVTFNSPSEFVVLATEDSTVIEVTPAILTVGFRPPGLPFTVTLDEGQTFQLQAFGDLSGSRVRSLDANKPLAVFAGARQAWVNCTSGADDHLYQQIAPLTGWGSEYRVVPFKLRGGDEVRVLSASDGNVLQITGQPNYLLDSGQVADIYVTVPLTITASAPVAVGQFNESQSCNPANGDPAYLWLEPSDRMDERAIWSSLTGAGTPSHYLNVVAQGKAGSPVVILDGVDVSAQLAPMTGVAGVYWAQYDVAVGEHVLECPSGCQGSAYGFGDYNSYAFQLGYGSSALGTGIPAIEGSGSETTILLAPDELLSATSFGMQAWNKLEVFDMSSRSVLSTSRAPSVVVALPPGHYLARCIDHRGAAIVKRLLVAAR
ncbi:MAG: IgGFc-binding protein, partial [Flavobacteriales bacterium]